MSIAIRRLGGVVLTAALILGPMPLAALSGSADASDSILAPPPLALSQINGDKACAMIRRALHQLAVAEREQAFALDLDPDGRGDSAMVQARLAILLERSNQLRDALRIVSQSAVAGDESVERCSAMGLHALVEAERLTTTVEEVLYGPNLGNPLPGANLRSDAVPTAPVPQAR